MKELFVSNLPYNIQAEDVSQLFDKVHLIVCHTNIYNFLLTFFLCLRSSAKIKSAPLLTKADSIRDSLLCHSRAKFVF